MSLHDGFILLISGIMLIAFSITAWTAISAIFKKESNININDLEQYAQQK